MRALNTAMDMARNFGVGVALVRQSNHFGPISPYSYLAAREGFASIIGSNATTQELNRDAGAALLDKIGPAIVMTHSQSGAIGWPIADARPKLVKAIVANEPSGPPFSDAVFSNNPARLWGVTDIPMTYDPPVANSKEISVVQQR